jgi:hypothetical protein
MLPLGEYGGYIASVVEVYWLQLQRIVGGICDILGVQYH